MARDASYISHWHQLIENFQASSQEFYAAFEHAVEVRSVPQIHSARVEHKEGNLASARREYLRMHRGKHAFDICAAPFGNGFFVSWWFTEPPLRYGFLYTMLFFFAVSMCFSIAYGIGFGIGVTLNGLAGGAALALLFSVFGVPIFLWLVGNALRNGVIAGESTVLAMPLVGWAYERVFSPDTYYKMDTALMFQDSVHRAVLEVVDAMTASKGIRALTEGERKPTMKRFAASV